MSAAGARLRWVGAETTGVVEAARAKLDLSPLASAALGRLLTGAALLHRLTAPEAGQFVLELRGDGPLGPVFAASDLRGRVRGSVTHRRADLPRAAAGKLPVGEGVGKGFLRAVREQGPESFQSQVELVTGEIGDDLAHYLEQSEQTRSAVLLGVLTRAGGVAAAGGMVIEVLPDATEGDLDRLAGNLAATRFGEPPDRGRRPGGPGGAGPGGPVAGGARRVAAALRVPVLVEEAAPAPRGAAAGRARRPTHHGRRHRGRVRVLRHDVSLQPTRISPPVDAGLAGVRPSRLP